MHSPCFKGVASSREPLWRKDLAHASLQCVPCSLMSCVLGQFLQGGRLILLAKSGGDLKQELTCKGDGDRQERDLVREGGTLEQLISWFYGRQGQKRYGAGVEG